jgi:hypothetical protein
MHPMLTSSALPHKKGVNEFVLARTMLNRIAPQEADETSATVMTPNTLL